MLQTSSYQSEESNSYENLKDSGEIREFNFDSITSNGYKQYGDEDYYKYFPVQMLDDSNCIIVREEMVIPQHDVVKLEEDNDSVMVKYEETSSSGGSGQSINDILKYLDNNEAKRNEVWNGSNNENVLNGPETIFIKKEVDYDDYYTHSHARPALGEIGLGLSPKLNQVSQYQNKLQLQAPVTFNNSDQLLESQLTTDDLINNEDPEYNHSKSTEEEEDYEEDYDDGEGTEDAVEAADDDDDEDEDYIESSKRGSKRSVKYKNKRSISNSYMTLLNFDKARLGESSKRKKIVEEEPLPSVASSSSISSSEVPPPKPRPKAKKDGRIGILVGKRTYRVSELALVTLRRMLSIEFQAERIILPKSKRFIKEQLTVNPEYLVPNSTSDAMIRQYGIPFDSIKSREEYFLLPPPETYTNNGKSYLGAEPTETLYDPVFIRRLPNDDDNHGWCEVCGRWLQLRNHTYAHHFKSVHGISQRTKSTVNLPRVIRGENGNGNKMQGYCEPCQCWIDLHHRRNGQRWQTWYIHQFQVHHKDQKANETQRPVPDANSQVTHLFSGYLG